MFTDGACENGRMLDTWSAFNKEHEGAARPQQHLSAPDPASYEAPYAHAVERPRKRSIVNQNRRYQASVWTTDKICLFHIPLFPLPGHPIQQDFRRQVHGGPAGGLRFVETGGVRLHQVYSGRQSHDENWTVTADHGLQPHAAQRWPLRDKPTGLIKEPQASRYLDDNAIVWGGDLAPTDRGVATGHGPRSQERLRLHDGGWLAGGLQGGRHRTSAHDELGAEKPSNTAPLKKTCTPTILTLMGLVPDASGFFYGAASITKLVGVEGCEPIHQ